MPDLVYGIINVRFIARYKILSVIKCVSVGSDIGGRPYTAGREIIPGDGSGEVEVAKLMPLVTSHVTWPMTP